MDNIILYLNIVRKKISYLASPFDIDSAKFLVNKLNLKIVKIASGEIESLDMLKYFSKLKLDVILSTGLLQLMRYGLQLEF